MARFVVLSANFHDANTLSFPAAREKLNLQLERAACTESGGEQFMAHLAVPL
jgi:hypothetical protein